jgi:probable rRNA maturation factor
VSDEGPHVVAVVVTDEREDPAALDSTPVALDRWRDLAAAVLAGEGVEGPAELNLAFVDERRMTELNETYMDEPGPTDVLSFPLDPDPDPGPEHALRLLGDVVICPAVALRNAAGPAGYEGELALLVVHGVLHLLGMDHAEPDEAAAMVARERHHLAAVGLERRA